MQRVIGRKIIGFIEQCRQIAAVIHVIFGSCRLLAGFIDVFLRFQRLVIRHAQVLEYLLRDLGKHGCRDKCAMMLALR